MSLEFLLKSFSAEDRPSPKPKKAKEEVSLAGILQRSRVKYKKTKKARPGSLNFNPSQITFGLCHRAKVAQQLGIHTIWVDPPAPKLELTFDIGHGIHDSIQGYFWKCGLLEGDFRCTKCDKTWWDVSPKECPFVKSHGRRFLEYREIPLADEEYHIVGRADGLILLEPGSEEKHLMDVKSIANRMPNSSDRQVCYEDLIEEAKLAHIIQLNFYMRMSGVHKGHLLYVAKNTSQIKSFYVEYDEELIQPYLDEIKMLLEWVEDLKSGKRKDLPQPCSRKDCNCEEITYSA